MILSTILQEKERIDRMLTKYQEELETLPKGTISEKKVRQSTYFYLKYREGKKVISRYIPKKNVEAVREQVEKRRHIETMIRSLQEEKAPPKGIHIMGLRLVRQITQAHKGSFFILDDGNEVQIRLPGSIMSRDKKE